VSARTAQVALAGWPREASSRRASTRRSTRATALPSKALCAPDIVVTTTVEAYRGPEAILEWLVEGDDALDDFTVELLKGGGARRARARFDAPAGAVGGRAVPRSTTASHMYGPSATARRSGCSLSPSMMTPFAYAQRSKTRSPSRERTVLACPDGGGLSFERRLGHEAARPLADRAWFAPRAW
jgi:hypothetical protein